MQPTQSNKKEKPIYRTYSFWGIISVLLTRVVLLFFFVSAAVNFEENYIATTIAMVISGLIFINMGSADLVVYTDRLEYWEEAIVPYLTRKQKFFYKDFKSIHIVEDVEKEGPSPWLIIQVPLMMMLRTRGPRGNGNTTHVDFVLVNGETKSVNFNLGDDDVKKALGYVSVQFNQHNNNSAHKH